MRKRRAKNRETAKFHQSSSSLTHSHKYSCKFHTTNPLLFCINKKKIVHVVDYVNVTPHLMCFLDMQSLHQSIVEIPLNITKSQPKEASFTWGTKRSIDYHF